MCGCRRYGEPGWPVRIIQPIHGSQVGRARFCRDVCFGQLVFSPLGGGGEGVSRQRFHRAINTRCLRRGFVLRWDRLPGWCDIFFVYRRRCVLVIAGAVGLGMVRGPWAGFQPSIGDCTGERIIGSALTLGPHPVCTVGRCFRDKEFESGSGAVEDLVSSRSIVMAGIGTRPG